jgi:hypothetical protein
LVTDGFFNRILLLLLRSLVPQVLPFFLNESAQLSFAAFLAWIGENAKRCTSAHDSDGHNGADLCRSVNRAEGFDQDN